MTMKSFTAAMFVLGLCGSAMATLPAGQNETEVIHLDISWNMMSVLEEIADTATVEHARCIMGYQAAKDTIRLESAFETPWLVRNATKTGANFRWDLCPHGTLAWWHSHPRDSVCELSFIDRQGARWLFAIISVGKGNSCFFWQKPDGTYERIPLERNEP